MGGQRSAPAPLPRLPDQGSGSHQPIRPLANVPPLFHSVRMEQIESQQLQQTILNAPAWALIGLSAPSERTRMAAALELADVIVSARENGPSPCDCRQIDLPL